jgi:hypothetical protein
MLLRLFLGYSFLALGELHGITIKPFILLVDLFSPLLCVLYNHPNLLSSIFVVK